MRQDSDVPPGLDVAVVCYPRVPLRSTLGYFPKFPPGTSSSAVLPLSAEFSRQILRLRFRMTTLRDVWSEISQLQRSKKASTSVMVAVIRYGGRLCRKVWP